MVDQTTLRVMVVDDDEEICALIKDSLEHEMGEHVGRIDVSTATCFSEGLLQLESGRYDIAVIDVRDRDHIVSPDSEAGRILFTSLKQTRFIPIIFLTGLPHLIQDLENPPFIQVVEKGGTLETLEESVRAVLNSGLPAVNRALVKHVDDVQRDYMWDFVAGNWGKIKSEADQTSVAYLLARRLALSLSDPQAAGLIEDLGSQLHSTVSSDTIHPMQFYVMPAIKEPSKMAGDIYRGRIRDRNGYWVMITPTCDLVLEKADYLLLAPCELLVSQLEYRTWIKSQADRSSQNKLKGILRNSRQGSQRERFMFLPGAMDLPDLVADLQRVVTISSTEFDELEPERIATLDSPFAEALTSQYVRFYGRIGTPNLDAEAVWQRIEHFAQQAEE